MATGRLKDVEDDAVYIQTERFNEYEKQFARAQEKRAKQQSKSELKGTSSVSPVASEDKVSASEKASKK